MQTGSPIILTAIEWIILVSVVGILFQVVKMLAARTTKTTDEQIKKNAEEIGNVYTRIHDIERDYSKKIDEVKTCVQTTRDTILVAVNDVRVEIAQNYVTKQDCRYIESQIKS
jgi:lipopolysaccharide biosynthesis regulator YciM